MKKFALYIAAFSLALSMPSCNLIGSGSDSDDKDAVYEDDPIEINEDDVIDPNDEAAFAKYGVSDDESELIEEEKTEVISEEIVEGVKKEESTFPAGTDLVNVKLTSPRHVDMILDQFDTDINTYSELMKDPEANAAKLETLMDHIVKITEKLNEAAEDGLVSEAQLERYQKQADKFLSIVNGNK